MGFWQDASPLVKGVIIVGGLAIVAAVVFWVIQPGGHGEDTSQQRGVSAPQ